TYHFGPPPAAAAWPVSLPARPRQPARPGQALAAVGGGFPIAMVVLGAALEAHWLRGPTLLGGGGLAAGEAGLGGVAAEGGGLAGAAAAGGWRVAVQERAPDLGPAPRLPIRRG